LATITGSSQCLSFHKFATIQNTYEASPKCKRMDDVGLQREYIDFVGSHCQPSTCCSSLNSTIIKCDTDLVIESQLQIDCSCASKRGYKQCTAQATKINFLLQKDTLRLNFTANKGKPRLKLSASCLKLSKKICDEGQCNGRTY
jgi:hypothetical protein